MQTNKSSKDNPFRSNLLLILSESKHREIFSCGSLSPSHGGDGTYVGSTDSYRRTCLSINAELLKLNVVMTAKSRIAVCAYQSPDRLTQALQSISSPEQFVVSAVNLNNEVEGSTIAASYYDDGLALNGAYAHYMSPADQLLIFSDCLEKVDSKWGYLLAELGRMYDEIIIVNPDCLRTRRVSPADLRQARMLDHTDTRREWSLVLLTNFALPSEEETVAKLTSVKDAEIWLKLQEEKKRQDELNEKQIVAKQKLKDLIKGKEVSPATEDCLYAMLLRGRELRGAKILNPDTVVLVSGRSEWGGSGGIGYYSQAVIIFRGQSETKEWCYRDRYSSSKDNWNLCIDKIGQIKNEEKGETIIFKVELLNADDSRWTEFRFARKTESPNTTLLSSKEQIAFLIKVDETVQSLLKIKEERWMGRPDMLRYSEMSVQLPSGESIYVKYQKPALQQIAISQSIGIAAFVLVEQIDHCLSDPQLLYECYCLKSGKSEPTLLFKDHSYDRAEGCSMISIVDLNSREAKIRTRGGIMEVYV